MRRYHQYLYNVTMRCAQCSVISLWDVFIVSVMLMSNVSIVSMMSLKDPPNVLWCHCKMSPVCLWFCLLDIPSVFVMSLSDVSIVCDVNARCHQCFFGVCEIFHVSLWCHWEMSQSLVCDVIVRCSQLGLYNIHIRCLQCWCDVIGNRFLHLMLL